MAINAQELQGQWNQASRARSRRSGASSPTTTSRSRAATSTSSSGKIQQKTGVARDAIEKFLTDLTAHGGSAVAQAAQAVGDFAHKAGDRLKETYGNVCGHGPSERYEQAEDLVRHNPGPVGRRGLRRRPGRRPDRRPGPAVPLSGPPRAHLPTRADMWSARALAGSVPFTHRSKDSPMLRWAIAFAIIALIAGALGFYGLADTSASIAKFFAPGLPRPVRDRPDRRQPRRRRTHGLATRPSPDISEGRTREARPSHGPGPRNAFEVPGEPVHSGPAQLRRIDRDRIPARGSRSQGRLELARRTSPRSP